MISWHAKTNSADPQQAFRPPDFIPTMSCWRDLMVGDTNRAVVVSVAQFDHGVPLNRRLGAQRDAKRLHRTLSKLGFKVDLHSDLSSKEIYELFQQGKRCFQMSFICLLSFCLKIYRYEEIC